MAILTHASVVSGKVSKSLLSRRERLSQPNVRSTIQRHCRTPKALGPLGAFHDREGPLQHRGDPRDELAGVPAIRPDQLQSREAGDQRRQHRFGPIAVLDPRRMDDDDEEQAEDIDDNVALAAADAFASVIAPDPPFSVVLTV
jgi:hypothetical protein